MATTPPTAPTTQALLGALADRPGATAAELAAAAGIGRSTAGKLLATLTAQGRVVRQPGGHQDGRRIADRWLLLPGAATNAAQAHNPAAAATTPATPTTATADPDQTRPGPGRLGAGELRGLVLACLADRADQALSPTTIANALGRSAGAVGNALRVLAGQGAVVQTQAAPRRYAIAEGGDQADPPG